MFAFILSVCNQSFEEDSFTTSKDGSMWITTVYGYHSSEFITSNTSIIVAYVYPEMTKIMGSSIRSNPACEWMPDQSYYEMNKYKFQDYKLDFGVIGVAKSLGISRKVEMTGHIDINRKTLIADNGEVTGCHTIK